MKNELGRKKDSIWEMRKPQLVQAARERLGMSVQEAEKETVGQLRLLLKEFNQLQAAAEGERVTGLSRKKHAELMNLCDQMGIPTEDSGGKMGLKCREAMIRDIRNYLKGDLDSTSSGTRATAAAQRSTTSQMAASTSRAGSSHADSNMEDGFEVLPREPRAAPTGRRGISRVARATPSTASAAADAPAEPAADNWEKLKESLVSDGLVPREATAQQLQEVYQLIAGIQSGSLQVTEQPR